MQISSGFFRTLGVKLFLGREFSAQEDLPGGAPVVLISHRLWRNRFARSVAALGKSIALDGTDYTIVGVAPAGFDLFGNDADVYTPLGQGDPLLVQDRSVHPGIVCFARLKPGVTVAQARAAEWRLPAGPLAPRFLLAELQPYSGLAFVGWLLLASLSHFFIPP